jgi:hypothetical protein
MVPTLSHTAKRSVSSFDGADAPAFTSVDLPRTCCLAEIVFLGQMYAGFISPMN